MAITNLPVYCGELRRLGKKVTGNKLDLKRFTGVEYNQQSIRLFPFLFVNLGPYSGAVEAAPYELDALTTYISRTYSLAVESTMFEFSMFRC